MNVFGKSKPSYNTKQEFIYQILRDAIMHCKLPPGHRLVIQDISAEYHVSPIPIREALRLLDSEHLVEHRPHIGTVVSPITSSSIEEIFTIKEALEIVAIRMAVEKMNLDEIAELERIVGRMEVSISEKRYEEWGDLNALFHETIALTANMPMLRETYQHIIDRWNRVRRYFFKDVLLHTIYHSQEEHYTILESVKRRDSEKAENLVKKHNRNALRNYMEHLAKQALDGSQ
ncbi:GntR family transcriptional regulator [Alicyclobacillus fodiniaquatilis]|uniref:GntR family transcriptional regulator n=1 Tax=Alicyclobacillus fodiniaquatilis TaxID=1661150 RepID=A0ABW4JD96_9BACL